MKENYMNLIKACLPDALIKAIAEKTNIDKNNVENCCLEVVARVFGDGNDLTRNGILERLKKVVEPDQLKSVLVRSETKYGMKASDASNVVQELLPILFKRVATLEDNYFDEEKVTSLKEEAIKKDEPTVDDVYNNIVKKAETQAHTETEPSIIKMKKVNKPSLNNKFKKPLFNKKPKVKKEGKIIENKEEDKTLNLIEKICMIVVAVALVALIGTIIFLFVKNKIQQ